MRTTGYAVDDDGSIEREKESHHPQALLLLLSHISFFSKQNKEEKKKIDDVYNPIIDIEMHTHSQALMMLLRNLLRDCL